MRGGEKWEGAREVVYYVPPCSTVSCVVLWKLISHFLCSFLAFGHISTQTPGYCSESDGEQQTGMTDVCLQGPVILLLLYFAV